MEVVVVIVSVSCELVRHAGERLLGGQSWDGQREVWVEVTLDRRGPCL